MLRPRHPALFVGHFAWDTVHSASSTRRTAGGALLHAARAAAMLGEIVHIAGGVEEGHEWDEIVAELSDAGLDTSGILRLPGSVADFMIIQRDSDVEPTLRYYPPSDYFPESVLELAVRQASLVLVCTASPATAEVVVRLCRLHAVPYALQTHELHISKNATAIAELARHARYVYLSRAELNLLTGTIDPRLAYQRADALLDRNAVWFLTSSESVYLLSSSGSIVLDTPRLQPVDTVGAGDAFAGACTAALARGITVIQAARFGIIAATMTLLGYSSEILRSLLKYEETTR